jgi:hypothetical protein
MKHSRKEGRFARANLTDDTNELTFLNLTGDIFEANNLVKFSSLLFFLLLVNSSLILLKKLLRSLIFVSIFLGFTSHLHVHFIEHFINVNSLDTPGERLVLDIDCVVRVSRWSIFFFDCDFRLILELPLEESRIS